MTPAQYELEDFPDDIYLLSVSRGKKLKKKTIKFFLNYIAEYWGEQSHSVPLNWGNFAHNTIEEVLKKPESMRRELMQSRINKYVNSVSNRYEEEVKKELNSSMPVLLDLMNRFEILELEKHIKTVYREIDPKSRLARLLYQMMPVDKRPENGVRGIGIQGFVDAYVKDGNDYVIIDWKTGNYSLQKLYEYELQVQIYAEMFRILGIPVDRGMIFWVNTGRESEVKVGPLRTRKEYDEFIDGFISKVNEGLEMDLYNDNCCGKWWCDVQIQCGMLNGEFDGMFNENFIKQWEVALN